MIRITKKLSTSINSSYWPGRLPDCHDTWRIFVLAPWSTSRTFFSLRGHDEHQTSMPMLVFESRTSLTLTATPDRHEYVNSLNLEAGKWLLIGRLHCSFMTLNYQSDPKHLLFIISAKVFVMLL